MNKLIFCIFMLISLPVTSTTDGALKTVSREASSSQPTDPVVKKSEANVCYEKSHIGYRKTMRFTAFNSMDECRNSGGRPPKVNKHN